MNIPTFINFAGQTINVHHIQEIYSYTLELKTRIGVVMADGTRIEDHESLGGGSITWLRETIQEAVAKEVRAVETLLQHERDKEKTVQDE